MEFESAEHRNRWIAESYRSGMSGEEIAEKIGSTPYMVCKIVRSEGVQIRNPRERTLNALKTGRAKKPTSLIGYKLSPEQIDARSEKIRGQRHWAFSGGGSSRQYRRKIKKDKCANCLSTESLVIHHMNGDHYDDRLENLQILCGSCHSRHHMLEKSKVDRDLVESLYRSGLSLFETAKAANVTIPTVMKVLKERDVPRRKRWDYPYRTRHRA